MRKNDVVIGETYVCKISGKVQTVRITCESPYGGYVGVNPQTGREIRLRSGGRLRRVASK